MKLPVSVLSVITVVCSALSLLGSIVVISSYYIARTKSKPKAAKLIHNLAMTDFFWFLASLSESSFWLTSHNKVPTLLCYICSPTIAFARLSSLVWTCAVSFDVLMSLNRRKWSWKDEEDRWVQQRRRYVAVVLLLALPATLLNIVKQHTLPDQTNLGCSPAYETIGVLAEVIATEVLPILCGFTCNLIVYFMVRKRMSQKSFPQSVRKRRRRIMYNYMIACIWCWFPTIVFYFLVVFRVNTSILEMLEVIARASLYLTGFVNFLIFGMSDPHLKRSFALVLYYLGWQICLGDEYIHLGYDSAYSTSKGGGGAKKVNMFDTLKTSDVEKMVMFGGEISSNADITKNKRESQRNIKLSIDDKRRLYKERPDLDYRHFEYSEPLLDAEGNEIPGSRERKSKKSHHSRSRREASNSSSASNSSGGSKHRRSKSTERLSRSRRREEEDADGPDGHAVQGNRRRSHSKKHLENEIPPATDIESGWKEGPLAASEESTEALVEPTADAETYTALVDIRSEGQMEGLEDGQDVENALWESGSHESEHSDHSDSSGRSGGSSSSGSWAGSSNETDSSSDEYDEEDHELILPITVQ